MAEICMWRSGWTGLGYRKEKVRNDSKIGNEWTAVPPTTTGNVEDDQCVCMCLGKVWVWVSVW